MRAINGVAVSGRQDKELLGKVRELTKHEREKIRIAAFLSHSYTLPKAKPTERFDDFIEVVDDVTESPAIREAALMGYSYHTHPAVLLKLHEVAADPKHAAWNAAVSRIGDVGIGFSAPLLEQLRTSNLSSEQTALLEDSIRRLKPRLVLRGGVNAFYLAGLIRQAAFAEATGHANVKVVRDWVIGWEKKTVDKELEILRDNYDFATFQKRSPVWLPEDMKAVEAAYESLVAEVAKRL